MSVTNTKKYSGRNTGTSNEENIKIDEEYDYYNDNSNGDEFYYDDDFDGRDEADEFGKALEDDFEGDKGDKKYKDIDFEYDVVIIEKERTISDILESIIKRQNGALKVPPKLSIAEMNAENEKALREEFISFLKEKRQDLLTKISPVILLGLKTRQKQAQREFNQPNLEKYLSEQLEEERIKKQKLLTEIAILKAKDEEEKFDKWFHINFGREKEGTELCERKDIAMKLKRQWASFSEEEKTDAVKNYRYMRDTGVVIGKGPNARFVKFGTPRSYNSNKSKSKKSKCTTSQSLSQKQIDKNKEHAKWLIDCQKAQEESSLKPSIVIPLDVEYSESETEVEIKIESNTEPTFDYTYHKVEKVYKNVEPKVIKSTKMKMSIEEFCKSLPTKSTPQSTKPQKIKMCESIKTGQKCRHGSNCHFAHTESELVVIKCRFGTKCTRSECKFSHSTEPIIETKVIEPGFNWVKEKVINNEKTVIPTVIEKKVIEPGFNWVKGITVIPTVIPTVTPTVIPTVIPTAAKAIFKIPSSLSETDIQKFITTMLKSGIKDFEIQYT